ncbi:hypothetical protein D3C85_819570 [compost metagenome]
MDKSTKAIIETAKKTPYFHLYDRDTNELYMERYWLKKYAEGEDTSIRIHKIMRSDDARALHDHPWASTSIILDGGYWEIQPAHEDQDPAFDNEYFTRVWRKAGDVTHRKAHSRHRLEVPEGGHAWTMFIMGKWEKDWGFYDADEKWVYWRDYLQDFTTSTSTDKAMA